MAEQRSVNMVRGLGFMAGILSKHQSEPLCGKCRAFAKTAEKVGGHLAEFSGSVGDGNLPADMQTLYSEAKSMIEGLRFPEEPVPQRKLGNCNLPEKGCFLKYSAAFFDKVVH